MALQGIQVWDNGGKTADRYTVRVGQKLYLMSSNPLSPSGVNLFAGNSADWQADTQDKELHSSMIPLEVLVAIFERAWPSAMETIFALARGMEQCSRRFRTAHNTCEEIKAPATFVHWLLTCSREAGFMALKARRQFSREFQGAKGAREPEMETP